MTRFNAVSRAVERARRLYAEASNEREVARRAADSAARHDEAGDRIKAWADWWSRSQSEPDTERAMEEEMACRECDGDARVSDGWCLDCNATGIRSPRDEVDPTDAENRCPYCGAPGGACVGLPHRGRGAERS